MLQANLLQGSALFERLRQATRLAHRRLERRIDLCCPNFVDVHNYRRLLQDCWSFYQPLEHKLAVLADHILPSPYCSQPRRKAPRLHQDLLSLGMTEADIAALPLCGRLPAIPTLPRAFGVLYVIDGVTLGERFATTPIHLVEDNLAVKPSHGRPSFSSLTPAHDPFADSYWQELIAMTEAVEDPSLHVHAIEAAVDTLDCLEAWLDYRHRPRRANYSQWNVESEPELDKAVHFDSLSGAIITAQSVESSTPRSVKAQ